MEKKMRVKPTDIKYVKSITNPNTHYVYNFPIDTDFPLAFTKKPQNFSVGDIVLLYQTILGEPNLTHLVEILEETVTKTANTNYPYEIKVKIVGRFPKGKIKENSSIADFSFKGATQGGNLAKIENMPDCNDKYSLKEIQDRIFKLFNDEGQIL